MSTTETATKGATKGTATKGTTKRAKETKRNGAMEQKVKVASKAPQEAAR